MQRAGPRGDGAGAVGLSSGLDYIPSLYAEEDGLAALCEAIAPFGGVYVTHMRRYDPAGVERVDGRGLPHRPAAPAAASTSRTSTAAPTSSCPCSTTGRAERHRRDVRPVLLPGRQHDPRHVRPAAGGAGGRHRRDAGSAERPRDLAAGCASWFANPRVADLDTMRLSYVAAPRLAAVRGPDAARSRRRPARPATSGRPTSSATCCWPARLAAGVRRAAPRAARRTSRR